MRTLVLLLALVATSPVVTAHAASIETTGVAEVDKVFREVGAIDSLLDAAEGRMDGLVGDVSKALDLPDGASMAFIAYTIKKKANGDLRIINVEGRSVLALGADAPSNAKDAASILNEGTQEIAQMATDLGRLPSRLSELAEKSSAVSITASVLSESNVADDVSTVKEKVEANLAHVKSTKARATKISKRAAKLLDDVKDGVSSTSAPAGPVTAPEPGPVPKPATETSPKPKPRPKPSGTSTLRISELTDKAWKQFNDAEIDEAVALLAQADALLPQQTQPVTRQELVELFEIRAMTNMVKGDATAAAWSATQSLVIHPNAAPLPKLGSDYARLHKALARTGVVRKVDVRVIGDGRAYLSGIEVTGGATIQLGQGLHLLQVERDGTWDSSVVTVREGFAVEF